MSARKPGLVQVMLAAVAALFSAGIVIAQELEDIVVTATRREQSLQEVGVSVTAFSDQQIREFGFTNTVDVAAMTPNLNYTTPNAEGSQINFFLRGVGLNDFADAQENPVAVYVDDVYKPAMGGLQQQLFDVDRIEVLRGPQGGLFGRNTTGGVVHYITRKPTEDFEAYVDASYGRFEQFKAEGAISGPLFSDRLLGRLSLGYNDNDGWTENRTPGKQDFNGTDAYAARGQLLLKATDDLEFLLSANYSDNDTEVGAWQHQATYPNPSNPNQSIELPANVDFYGSCPGCDVFGYRDSDGDPWDGDYDRDGDLEVKNKSVAATMDWRLGGLDLTAILAYTNVERLQEEDTEMNPFAAPANDSFVAPTFEAETDTYSVELRLADNEGQFRWLVGGYYFDNDVDADYTLTTNPIGFVSLLAESDQDTEAYDAFGSVEYDLNDNFTLLGSLRISHEEKELDFTNTDSSGAVAFCSTLPPGSLPDPGLGCFNPTPTPFGIPTRPTANDMLFFSPNTVGDLAKFDDEYWSGKVELDWKPNDDLLFYGAISRGVKSPGFNSGFLDQTQVFGNNPPSSVPFDDETLLAYEIGGKSTLFDGMMRLNGSAFYYDYEDFQTFQFLVLNQVIFNTDAEVFGFEVEMSAVPMEGLDIGLGVGYLDTEAEDIPTLDGSRVEDRDMVAAPEWSVNGYARYEWPALGGTMSVMGWGNYVKDIYYDIQNHPISKEDDYTVVNFRGAYLSGDERWEIYGEVLNAFDEEYRKYTFDFTGTFGFNQEAYGAPQWWRAGFRLNFGGDT